MENQTIDSQTIAQGPAASQIAIKMLGTNGGGFFNANASHPFENPTPLSNFLADPLHIPHPQRPDLYLGRMVKNQRHGWTVWGVMLTLFLAGVLTCWWAEAAGNPRLQCTRRGSGRREHGRQGGPFRDFRVRPVRHGDNRCLLRGRQRHARFLHATGRP